MAKTIIDSYNELVPTMNKLAEEGHNIWEFHSSAQGFGFKVIEDKIWIEVLVGGEYASQNCKFYINKYKKEGNILCSFLNKELDNKITDKPLEVFNIIKGLL